MCFHMLAHHIPCKHLHRWLARCYWAKWMQIDCCEGVPNSLPTPATLVSSFGPTYNYNYFPTWVYYERYSCPECLGELRREADGEVRRWSGA